MSDKMKIFGYSDAKFSSESGSIEVQINPSSLKYARKAKYNGGKNPGTSVPPKTFYMLKETALSFEFVFDETGVIPLMKGEKPTTIPDLVDEFEKIAYRINGETHQPNFLKLSWGNFIFKGRLTALDYDYTLFRPDGSPLRVKVKVGIEGYLDPLTEARQVGRSSPDLTRRICLTDGETLARWCDKIYGDASYCVDVARANGLPGFRHIEPGTEVVFPPLKRK